MPNRDCGIFVFWRLSGDARSLENFQARNRARLNYIGETPLHAAKIKGAADQEHERDGE
jgi:hypothetical protein